MFRDILLVREGGKKDLLGERRPYRRNERGTRTCEKRVVRGGEGTLAFTNSRGRVNQQKTLFVEKNLTKKGKREISIRKKKRNLGDLPPLSSTRGERSVP